MEGIFPPDCLKLFEQNELADVQNEQINSFSSKIQNKLPFFSAVLDNESFDLTHIFDSSLRGQVQHLVKGYEPAKEPKGTDLRLNVALSDEIPVSQRSRRMPFAEQKIVDKQIDEWLEKGIIKPSCSDYASPILLTKKRDGTHRLCVDFRKLNKKVVKYSFPMAQIEEQGKPIELHTDASSHGFGAVLLQRSDDGELHPIHYMSKKTLPQQEKLSSYELEVLAIVEALKKFRSYLLGTNIKIVTDCDGFQKTMQKRDLTPKIARWSLLLEEFEYQVAYRSGQQMRHVDALSRNAVCMVTRSQSEITRKIATAQEADEHIHLLKTLVEKGLRDDYIMKENVLKRGKGEGLLNPIPKDNIPLSTYHVEFIGPLPSTNKRYQHIFTVVDAFAKFVWFYPVKTTLVAEALQKLKIQQIVFGNPSRIISDKGFAFTSKDFEDYCKDEGIQHIQITTGVPRANSQIERMHGTLIPVLAKLSIDDPAKRFKFVPDVQRIMNSTVSRSTKFTPFELVTGVKMRNKAVLKIKEILDEEYMNSIIQEKETIREEAKVNIFKVQEENRRQYNRRRRTAPIYKINDLVAINRTQLGGGLKLKPKFLGPYKVVKFKPH
ncbi:Pro-Pol polyprotein [Araneus ventricosus]|uniref:Pro-Pol polyprotein n=1 Tax=Araneus ventricosus TaxID=182803 RepID=A0A4Y2XA72_ARAVE|nr:Pro-Pol polyprotein [Araneus ventricosus]